MKPTACRNKFLSSCYFFLSGFLPFSVKKKLLKLHLVRTFTNLVRRKFGLSPCYIQEVVDIDSNYEPDITGVIRRFVRRGWVCVDVGAHIGHITIELAKDVGSDGCVFAFEPHPDNVQKLKKNLRLMKLEKQVKIVQGVVSDKSSGYLELFSGRQNSSFEWNIVGHDVEGHPTASVMEVRSYTLDDYFKDASRIDFVKIDVEGAEGRVLTGMQKILEKHRPVVVIEFHDKEGWTSHKLLLEKGYVLFDTNGTRIATGTAAPRIWHCVALPSEITQKGF